MTRPGIEAWSPGPLANTQLVGPKLGINRIIIQLHWFNNNQIRLLSLGWEPILLKDNNGFKSLLLYNQNYSIRKASEINPGDKSEVRIFKTVWHCLQTCSHHSCRDTGNKVSWAIVFLQTTSVAWRREICRRDKQPLFYSILSRLIRGRGSKIFPALIQVLQAW